MKIGDKVRVIGNLYDGDLDSGIFVGQIGKIINIDQPRGFEHIGVELQEFENGHTLEGTLPADSRTGWYLSPEQLEIVNDKQ